jgi:UDP-GlcNAc3NAcA epimerase
LKIATIVGARPQFIKAAAVSRAIATHNVGQTSRSVPPASADRPIEDVIIHTGQHYDANMSQVFFEELAIPEPRYNLGIGSLSHAVQTGRMLQAIEPLLVNEKPDWVLVYGDTNSTLAGALAARKLNLNVAHVEAGLRSFNRRMPEEINRVLADRISDLLFCPTDAAVENLQREGVTRGVEQVGDVMFDASLFSRERARRSSRILETMRLAPRSFVLATVHRAENTDDPARLGGICDGLARVAGRWRVVLALHPRTRRFLAEHGMNARLGNVEVIDPVPYLDMIRLEESARAICTDSGGVQKEAFFYRVPCVTLRDETEWVETVAAGWNTLVSADAAAILRAVEAADRTPPKSNALFYGDGNAAGRIVEILLRETRR